jgi:serine/threonine-protein kinase RsbW
LNRPLHVDVRRLDREGAALELSLDVPSDLACVGDAVELVAQHCHAGPLSPRRVRFNLRTALAEALSNAILYGNAQDPALLVRVRVQLDREAVRIHVSDEGLGFDRTGLPDPTRPENLEREDGRGLFVIRHLVDHLTFNEKGNVICLTLRAG